jgi:hypothetical protein
VYCIKAVTLVSVLFDWQSSSQSYAFRIGAFSVAALAYYLNLLNSLVDPILSFVNLTDIKCSLHVRCDAETCSFPLAPTDNRGMRGLFGNPPMAGAIFAKTVEVGHQFAPHPEMLKVFSSAIRNNFNVLGKGFAMKKCLLIMLLAVPLVLSSGLALAKNDGHHGKSESRGHGRHNATAVPEIDASGAALALALMGGVVSIAREKRRRQS